MPNNSTLSPSTAAYGAMSRGIISLPAGNQVIVSHAHHLLHGVLADDYFVPYLFCVIYACFWIERHNTS